MTNLMNAREMRFFTISIIVLINTIYCYSCQTDTIYISKIDDIQKHLRSNTTLVIQCDGILGNLNINNIENISLIADTHNFYVKNLEISAIENALLKNLKIEKFTDSFGSKSIVIINCQLSLDPKSYKLSGGYHIENSTLKNIYKDSFFRANCIGLKIIDSDLYINSELSDLYISGANNCKIYNMQGDLLSYKYNGYYPDSPLSITANIENDIDYDGFCPSLVKYSASSTLQDYNKINYNVKNLTSLSFDLKHQFAWVEGEKGYGIGEKINFQFLKVWDDWTFWGAFYIINGYAKDTLTWKNNSRVKEFKVYRNNVYIANVKLEDVMSVQRFTLTKALGKNEPSIGDIFTFEIVDVYAGDKYKDTAISYFVANCSP